jgi:hypothetical protein
MDKDLMNLYSRNKEIEELFEQRLKQFELQISEKEKKIAELQELTKKETTKLVSKRWKGAFQDPNLKSFNENSLDKIKNRVKKIFSKIDENNKILTNLVKYIQNNNQTGGSKIEEIEVILDQIEIEISRNLKRINSVDKEIKNFLKSKNLNIIEMEDIVSNKKSDLIEEKIDFDQQARNIIEEINNIEYNIKI